MKRFLCLAVLIGLVGCGEAPKPASKVEPPKTSRMREVTITDEHGHPRTVTVPDLGEVFKLIAPPEKLPPATTVPPTVKMPGNNPPAFPPPATKGSDSPVFE